MKWDSFKYLAKEGCKNVWLNRIMSLASICVLVSCMVVTGTETLLISGINRYVKDLGSKNVINVFLDLEADEFKSQKIGEQIQKIDNIKTCEFVSRDEALKKFSSSLGDMYEELKKDTSFLPNAFKITLNDSSKYKETIAKVKQIEGVDIIKDRSEVADKISNMARMVQNVGLGITIALSAISLFIIANTIKVTMYGRRFEISIMKSVGATNGFIRFPFIVEGMVIGLISALLSLTIISLAYRFVFRIVNGMMRFTQMSNTVISLPMVIIFVLIGMAFGIAGGGISIRRYFKSNNTELIG